MADERDELREKVVTALRTVYSENEWGTPDALVAWDDLMQQEKQCWYKEADAAIAVALEEAAKLAEAKADEWATVWRNRMKADSHMEGKSAGADEIAAAIRAMIKEG